ncbi:L-seryl-tRNA(Sec) selenium transferase [Treponema primitia]|uniref:L-seryl-tRNA(Sec) selenium transferase n=1 Tax=Treponema primitia TaxID=88058 RepID=UPI0002555635|nr:L-seryl-tRNA(Sec) selenium transferase [Treponema primitia]
MTLSDANALLRSIPAMDDLLNAPWAAEFSSSLGRENVKKIIEETLDEIRREIGAGNSPTKVGVTSGGVKAGLPVEELVVIRATTLLRLKSSSTLKPVVNATGVVIHTNLGRAPLADEAIAAVNEIAGTYSTLEYDPGKGGRGGRNVHVEWLLCRLTGAEAALVVNNNAAAVLLALSATASGRELIVSSGELVEIGDSFRIPEILSFSGAKMIAVGCTNSTRISDYRNAITENTAVLLKVHPSNYRIEGFVKTTAREELAELAAERGLVFMEDLGSGLLGLLGVPGPLGADLANRECSVRNCLEAGSGIVTFSGDKLLGGPQIGVIAGSKKLIDKMKSHQLLRALRVDKMTLAAFEATLRLHLSGRQGSIPVIGMIETDKPALLEMARRLCRMLKRTAACNAVPRTVNPGAGDFTIAVVETEDAIGGGSFPTDLLPGFGVAISSPSFSAETLAAGLRTAFVPVIPAIREGRVILHVRTLLPGDEKLIAASFVSALSRDVAG